MFNKKILSIGLGLLVMTFSKAQDKIYKAGEVYTQNIYQYGKMEVRMLAATGSGVISNFFTYKEGSELDSTFWEEIDIEVFGKDGANSWQSNLITGQGNTDLLRTEGIHQENGLGTEYHTYSIEWTPNSVTWLVDNVIVREIIDGQSLDISSQTSLRFNIWNPSIPEWVGAFDESILPVHMYVNWIKYYEWNGDSFNETPSLEDNFDTFDTETWTKANHTFDVNMSDFIPENVNVVDGYLVLSITKQDEIGYNETPPTDQDENTLSLNEVEKISGKKVTISPNPSSNNFKFTFETEEKVTYELYSASGKILKKFSNSANSIFGENLSSGIYFVKAIDEFGNPITTKTIIKQ